LRKRIRDKKERHRIQCERGLAAWDAWLVGMGVHAELAAAV
jgi:methylenetetrahydrofolate--tRNA-(uracil-5-)-methyltransferase